MVGTGLKESLTGLRSTCLNRNMHVLDAGKISDHANAEVQGMSKCTHENMEMVYDYIPGEAVKEPIGELCPDCGYSPDEHMGIAMAFREGLGG